MSSSFTSPKNQMEFYLQVWELVKQIPPGKVATYGQLASLLPPPQGVEPQTYRAFGPRWIGGAMAACPEGVPWQRVVNSQGKISLRKGIGSEVQRELLESEGVIFDSRERIDLKRFGWKGPNATDEWLQSGLFD